MITGKVKVIREIFLLMLLLLPLATNGGRFEFIFDNDSVFDNCPEIRDNNGLDDAFDLEHLHMEFDEGRITIIGNSTCVWKGIEPTDRIQATGEFFKFHRGTWQLTPFTISVKDFCKVQFDPGTVWYQVWTKNIPETEHKCLSNYGHMYHHNTFSIDTTFAFPVNMEGRYKVVVHVEAYDEMNIKRSKIICFQIFGEFIKSK